MSTVTDYNQILLNRIRTPDGTILTSWGRHDYKTHNDANGLEYMVDGGPAYLRRNVNPEAPYEELSEYYRPDDHEHNRQYAHWGSRGIDGQDQLHYKPVSDLDTDHIQAILDTQWQIDGNVIQTILREELEFRKQ